MKDNEYAGDTRNRLNKATSTSTRRRHGGLFHSKKLAVTFFVASAILPLWSEWVRDENYEVIGGAVKITSTPSYSGGAIVIPSTLEGKPVTSIGVMAFAGISGLTSVTIPDSVTSIGDWAFYACSGLMSISLPSVTSIGSYAFANCRDLLKINLSDTIETIGDGAFEGTGITELRWPSSLKVVSPHVCSGCLDLKRVILHQDVTEIGEYAFTGTGQMTDINLDVTKTAVIGERAFYSCVSLSKVVLPATVKHIGEEAFFRLGAYGCPTLVVFRGSPPSCGEKAFIRDEYLETKYYEQPLEQWRSKYSASHSVFGVYLPDALSANANAWRECNELDDWGRWNEVQMVMDVKPIGCDYATDNCGELNISWQAFPAYTNDFQKDFWHRVEINLYPELVKMTQDEFYAWGNWSVHSQMKYSIWRSSENLDDAYDDFSCAVNIAQHVGGEFTAEKGFSATNFIDKTFGKFPGTKPVKYWIEIEDPDDPDNLRYLPSGSIKPTTRIRPIAEPDACVTRRRIGLAIGVGAFDPNGKTASQKTISEPGADVALFKELYNSQYADSNIGYDELINANATVKKVGDALRRVRYNDDGAIHAQPGDILIMYMAMHGEDGRLVLYDDYYTLDQLYEDLKPLDESSGVKVIAILMACHSQSISDFNEGRDDKLEMPRKFDNVAWITSCRANQVSSSIGDGLSLFGRCFLDFGWQQGYADISQLPNLSNMGGPWGRISFGGKQDGTLTFGELADYTFCLAVGSSSLLRSQVCITNGELLKNTVVRNDCITQNVIPPQEPTEFQSISADGSVVLRWRDSIDCQFYCVYYRTGNNDWEYRLINSPKDGGYIVVKLDNVLNYKDQNISKLEQFFIQANWYIFKSLEKIDFSNLFYKPLAYGKMYEFKVVGVNQGGIGKCSGSRKENVLDFSDLSRTELLQYKGPVFLNSGERAGSLSASVRSVHSVVASAKITNAKAKVNDNDGSEVAIEVLYVNGDDTSFFAGTGFIASNGVCNTVLTGEAGSMNVEITSYGIIAVFQGMTAYCLRDTNNRVDVAEEYMITFNANGGSVSPETRRVASGLAVGTLPTATRNGYTLVGWFTAASGGEAVTAETIITADVTYYAHWTQNGGGEGSGGSDDGQGSGQGGGDTPLVTYGLYGALSGPVSSLAASEYNGYLYDGEGNLKGTIQVKVGKPNKKTGLAAVKATVVGLDGKKKTLKAAEKGKAQIAADGPTTVSLTGGEACEVVLGAKGMAGKYGSFTIDGSLNVFASKDAADKTVASGVLAKWQGVVNVAWWLAGDSSPHLYGSPYQTLSVSIANKGKAKVAGTLADGAKVSASSQLIVGEEWCCVPVVYVKKGARLAFGVWLPGRQGEGALPTVIGLGEGVIVGKPGTLKAGATFKLGGEMGDAKYGAYLPDGMAVGGGAKWTLPKAGKVQLAKDGAVDVAKLGANPSALKLTYKAKDGTFKGSFKVYADASGKPKATTVKVVGVLVNGTGYGAATVKGGGGVPVKIE